MSPKIICWDLETTNLNSDFGFLLCFGYKQVGHAKARVLSITDFPRFKTDPTNDKDLVRAAAELLWDADCWVTHYGSRFDAPYLQSRLLYHGLAPMPPVQHIDTWRIARYKMKLHSNRLASVSAFLGLEEKTPLDGPTWVRAAAGHKPAINYIKRHCAQDVEVLEQAYLRIRPLMTNHPSVSVMLAQGDGCPTCGAHELHKRGVALTQTRMYQRYQCQKCGSWCREVKSEMSGSVR